MFSSICSPSMASRRSRSDVKRDPPGGSLGVLESLVSPYGPIATVSTVRLSRGLSRVRVAAAFLAWLDSASASSRRPVSGVGRAFDDADLAKLIAIAEAAERYAARDLLGERRVVAREAELPGAVIDMKCLPQCSASERENPACPWRPYDASKPIRWVQGVDLVTGQAKWLPAVMACYGTQPVSDRERFWFQISTGWAVDFDLVEALVRAICEVIERDAVAVLWHQRMPLPLMADQCLSDGTRYLLEWARRHFVRFYLFDATTDLGVPTVYCLCRAEHDERIHTIVGCATGRTMTVAAEKAMLEALGIRELLPTRDTAPLGDPSKFMELEDGMRYMATRENAHAFNFLTRGAEQRQRRQQQDLPCAAVDALVCLIGRLADAGMEAVAVDRTPRELSDVGLFAVNVVIPQLQPMSVIPLVQFQAHPRLYELPMKMGYPVHAEEHLNPWPQPFA